MESIPKDPILQFQPDTMEAIRKIYNLDGHGRMEEAVNILDEWCKKQTHFKKKDFGKPYLERTLVACKGSVEKAKKQIDKMCTLRTLLPQFFVDCNLKENLKSIKDVISVLPLPTMTKDYYRVYLMKVMKSEITAENFMEYYRLNLIVCEYLKQHDYANGFIIIYDYRKLNLVDMMLKMNITQLQQFMTILIVNILGFITGQAMTQRALSNLTGWANDHITKRRIHNTEGFGARMLGLHVLTESKSIDAFLKFIKPFLSAKIAGRIHAHTNIENLQDIIDREILPIEYGGSERSVYQLHEDWIRVLTSDEHVEYIKMMNQACTDENCRQTDTFYDQYMGTPGSFRMLNLD